MNKRDKAETADQNDEILAGWRAGLLCLATAVGFQACFAPMDQAWLAYIVLVPWAVAMARVGRRAWLWAYLTGLVVFAAGLYWLSWVTLIGYVGVVLYLGLYWPAAAWFVRRSVRGRVPLWLTLPIVWTASEYLRAYVMSGFPWLFLGHSQYRMTHLVQIADITGACGVSFLVAMINGLVADAVLVRLARSGGGAAAVSRKRLITGAAVTALLVGGFLGYGAFRLDQAEGTTSPGPRVAVVQTAVPLHLGTQQAARDEDLFTSLLELTGSLDLSQVDLVVWPETVLPYMFDRHWDMTESWPAVDADRYPAIREYIRTMQARHKRLAALLAPSNTTLVAGGTVLRRPSDPWQEMPDIFNSALLLRAQTDQAVETVDVYHKMHCVPFSEYVPFRESAPWLYGILRKFVPDVMSQLTPGRAIRHFRFGTSAGQWTTAVPICYEGVFSRVCRKLCYRDGVKEVDILTNISNDGWFIWPYGQRRWASSELDQHLAAYVFRAIENRVPVVRAVNTGASGFVDSSGRIRQLATVDGQNKMVAATAVRQVSIDRRRSIYSRIGYADAVTACAAAIVLGVVLHRRTRKPKGKGTSS